MKTTKILGFVALLVGFAGGYCAVKGLFRSRPDEVSRLGRSVEFTRPLYAEYAAGDYARARGAMLAVARHLDDYEAESARRGVAFHNVDGMMAYVRLAKLEEGRGRGGEARAAYASEAAARCERLRAAGGWRRGCEESSLRAEVDRTDALMSPRAARPPEAVAGSGR